MGVLSVNRGKAGVFSLAGVSILYRENRNSEKGTLVASALVADVADNCPTVRRNGADADIAMCLQSGRTIRLWEASFTVVTSEVIIICGNDVERRAN